MEGKNILNTIKVKLYKTFVVPIVLYSSKCWCLRKEDERRILVAEMAWLRRLLTRRDRMKNETVRSTLRQERRLVDRKAQRRLTMVRHVSRMGSERLPVKVMFCSITGRRNQKRQPKKWIENIKQDIDTRNIQFDEAMATMQDRVKWKRLIAASSSY